MTVKKKTPPCCYFRSLSSPGAPPTPRASQVAKKINACYLLDTSAKNPDKATSGVDELLDAIMTLGFMYLEEEQRPSYGELNYDEEDEAAPEPAAPPANPLKKMRSSLGPETVEPKKAEVKDKSGNVVEGPAQTKPVEPCPPADGKVPQKDPEEAGCQCVIA